jgi:hypothetical protein
LCPSNPTSFHFWSVSLSLVAPTLEHVASVNRSDSLQFLNRRSAGRTPWTGGSQPVARPLPTQTQNKRRPTAIPLVGF